MPNFEEGNTMGKGRPKGSPNKTTKEIREAYQMFTENNMDKFQEWIDTVAKKNPAKAMEIVLAMSEYFLPKLQRTEVSHEGEIDIKTPTINFTKSESE